jgi:hypothetical protein
MTRRLRRYNTSKTFWRAKGRGVIYFGIAGAAFLNAIVLLWTKYVKKTKRATRDRGAYTLFAMFMLFISACAFMLGLLAG